LKFAKKKSLFSIFYNLNKIDEYRSIKIFIPILNNYSETSFAYHSTYVREK